MNQFENLPMENVSDQRLHTKNSFVKTSGKGLAFFILLISITNLVYMIFEKVDEEHFSNFLSKFLYKNCSKSDT